MRIFWKFFWKSVPPPPKKNPGYENLGFSNLIWVFQTSSNYDDNKNSKVGKTKSPFCLHCDYCLNLWFLFVLHCYCFVFTVLISMAWLNYDLFLWFIYPNPFELIETQAKKLRKKTFTCATENFDYLFACLWSFQSGVWKNGNADKCETLFSS